MELQTDGGTDVAQRRWAAVGWSDSEHAAVVVNEVGERVAAFKAPHSSEGLEALVARLREFGPLGGIALETTRNVAIHKLLEVGTAVYPLNPSSLTTGGRVLGGRAEGRFLRCGDHGLRSSATVAEAPRSPARRF